MEPQMKFSACLMILVCSALSHARLIVREVGEARDPATIQLRGLRAGVFDPKIWQAGKLNFVKDARWPLLEPRPGKFRNIYAPSAVKTEAGWAIFYGGWDGSPTGNDQIYRTDTADFLSFTDRRTVIEHNVFQHVCNVNASRDGDRWALMCTAYPDSRGRNKPITVLFDGTGPHAATMSDIITMDNYGEYDDADINGVNVMLRENGKYRMYFANFRHFIGTCRASSEDGGRFTFDGVVLDQQLLINDVKKLKAGDESWYLAGFHQNTGTVLRAIERRHEVPVIAPALRARGEGGSVHGGDRLGGRWRSSARRALWSRSGWRPRSESHLRAVAPEAGRPRRRRDRRAGAGSAGDCFENPDRGEDEAIRRRW
jgi:hypothetical protein